MKDDTRSGDVVLTFSGEIYNFTSLRNELIRHGHAFATRSDTEVVLKAYLQWGDQLVDHLNGMFAFAIWDSRSEVLLLARDRMGIKPLFIMKVSGGVLFASEPKAILSHPQVRRHVDADGLRELFGFTNTPGRSVWAGVMEMRPGSVALVRYSGIQARRYWRLEARRQEDSPEVAVNETSAFLRDIVKNQLVSDVPLGLLLSGGLDSSLLAALARPSACKSPRFLQTFTVDIQGVRAACAEPVLRSNSDTPFAIDVATHLNCNNRVLIQNPSELADAALRQQVVYSYDMPSGFGDIDASLYLFLREVKSEASVLLSGEAADELFGGYAWFHLDQTSDEGMFPWLVSPRSRWSAASPFYSYDLRALLGGTEYVRQCYTDAAHEMNGGEAASMSPLETKMQRSCYLHLTRFLPSMLDRKDRLSMANGVEVRVPYCDHRLVEYIFNTTWAVKTFDGREKSILRAAAAPYLPSSTLERRKNHYPAPNQEGYLRAIESQVWELLRRPDHQVWGLFDRLRFSQAINQPMSGKLHVAVERLLDTATWLDLYNPSLSIQ